VLSIVIVTSSKNAGSVARFESVESADPKRTPNQSQTMRVASPGERELTVAQSLVRLLEREGVTHVFGVPGGPLTGLFEATRHSTKLEFVLAKHEGGAAYMAASHARVTGKLAVCCATSGPGATNALTGIAGARADSLPVLLLTGQVAQSAFGKGAIQESSVFETDLVSLFRPITKMSAMLPTAERAPAVLRGAIRLAMSGRKGPVHVNLPADLLRKPAKYRDETPIAELVQPSPAPLEQVVETARLLERARSPMILAGHGVAMAGAQAELQQVAQLLGARVATSPKGKSVFVETDPLSVGVLGFGGHDAAEQLLRSGDVDVLLVIGSSMNEFVTSAWTLPFEPKTAMIQVDVDPVSLGKNYPLNLAIAADARVFLQQLRSQLLAQRSVDKPRVATSPGRSGHRLSYLAEEAMYSEKSPLKPQRLMKELREAMPDDALLFVDNGSSIIWGGHYFETRQPGTYFVDLGLASMGSAVAGVVGGALGAGGRRCVALVGDAAFAMHGLEVHTAVEYKLPIVWIVLNNGGHGMVHQGDKLMHGEPLGVSDFRWRLSAAGIAHAVGARGLEVHDPHTLRWALEIAMAADDPTVIDVIIDAEEPVPGFARRVQTLSQFLSSESRRPPAAE